MFAAYSKSGHHAQPQRTTHSQKNFDRYLMFRYFATHDYSMCSEIAEKLFNSGVILFIIKIHDHLRGNISAMFHNEVD